MFPCASVISDVSVISDFSGRFPARRRFSIGIPDVSGRNSGCFEIWVSEWGVRYFSCERGSERGRGGGRERERERERESERCGQGEAGQERQARERAREISQECACWRSCLDLCSFVREVVFAKSQVSPACAIRWFSIGCLCVRAQESAFFS